MADPIELCRYQYDALDRLATRTPLSEAIARRFYNGDSLATELQGIEHHTILRIGNQLLAHKNQSGIVLLGTDQQNSVLHADDIAIAYAPYGHREKIDVLPGLPGFNGEPSDPVTGHYLLGNGYRAYNPVLMRFNSPDSLSPFGSGGLNAYAYCIGDPVNRSDPTGHVSWPAGMGLGLSVIGILASIATFGAATPLAIAGLATGVASGAAGVAQAVTEKSNPEASSVLGWVGLGLGVASAGFGATAVFQRVGNRIHESLVASGGLSGRNAGGLGIGNIASKGIPPPSPTLEGMPMEIMDKITKNLPGQSMGVLSRVSPRMNNVVNRLSASRFQKVMDKTKSYGGVIMQVDNIGMGSTPGIAPSVAKRAGFTLAIAQADYPEPMIRRAPNGKWIRYGGIRI
ncbi:RHS repeat-associated core domain-containing protein [Pseudomonas sp. DSP3-2-2]|uniref:RHS repeat-associated core domain-containing protein n=1 Tax=unclassified Pseudomonas TaxID=196821 RepID=UPI003CFB815A